MAAARQLDEIRMPLHILLENRFGDLNENQEEMLAAARTAADDAQGSLERLREVADIDRGALRLRTERVRLADLVGALLPGLVAEGARASVTVTSHLSPYLSAVTGDRARLGQALSLLAVDAVRRTGAGGEVRITGDPPEPAERGGGKADDSGAKAPPPGHAPVVPSTVQLVLTHGIKPPRVTDVALADRLIVAQGGHAQHEAGRTIISMPAAPDLARGGAPVVRPSVQTSNPGSAAS